MRKVDPRQMGYLRLLLYGEPGSTKTRTAATAALDERTSPVLMLNAGGNPISFRDYPTMPDVLEIEELKDLNPVYNWLINGQRPSDPIVDKFQLTPGYKTVILDSMTDLQRMSLGKVSGSDDLLPGDMPPDNDYRYFGKVLSQMVKVAMWFYERLQLNVIMTALEHSDKNEATGTITYKPLIWGQSSVEVAGYAYIVARMVHRTRIGDKAGMREDAVSQNATSVALFKPSGIYVAKDQTGRLGNGMTDPTITKILDKIERKPTS